MLFRQCPLLAVNAYLVAIQKWEQMGANKGATSCARLRSPGLLLPNETYERAIDPAGSGPGRARAGLCRLRVGDAL